MSKKVLLVGCGQLGSRHLQAIASLKEVGEIQVVDPFEGSLELGKARIKEISDLNPDIKFEWFTSLNNCSSAGDICVVSTQSRGRCALIKQIAGELGYKNFLIEKIVSQSIAEYQDLMSFARKNKLSIWVNCKTRAYSIHKYIKSKISPNETFIFSNIGGNHGLGNNGLHAADLFIFYDGSKQIKVTGSRIDPVLHPSKRGKGVYDLSGSLYGYTDKGNDFALSFSAGHDGPDHISIVSKSARFIVEHFQKFAYESFADQCWAWRQVPLDGNWAVSHMSKAFVAEIFSKGSCELPTLADCFPAHEFILGQLQPHFNRLLKVENNYCPIT
ncbi:MAG: hypothetical protein ABIC39_06450 [Pseudomonadota bacterium]